MMKLQASDLILCDKEMLERDYEGREADLLYRVNIPGGKEVYIFTPFSELCTHVKRTYKYIL